MKDKDVSPSKGKAKHLSSAPRRNFLRNGLAVTGATFATGLAGFPLAWGDKRTEPLDVPEWTREMGREIPDQMYGKPSKYEEHVFRERSKVFENKQRWSDWSMTPLQHQEGIVTPNGLVFERHHAGTPSIDPEKHRLVIHGLVEEPLVFTMDALMRYPSVSRFHFLECSGNTLTDWDEAASPTVQQSHGMLAGVQWTGVPAAWLLDEAGIKPEGKWVLFEGADGAAHTRSIPLQKVMDDALIVYGMNGEKLREENGYPVRLLLPGWEGNTSVKWLRRIKVVEEPYHFRSETARYTDPMPDGKWRQFSMIMETKSVITRPSAGMTLNGTGLHEIQGFAWSGYGPISKVDVTVDGGKTWHQATLEEPVLDKMLTRFRFRWNWNGEPTRIASRATDVTGYVQPTVRELAEVREITGFVQHHNGIFPWVVTEDGEVKNGVA